MHKDPLKREIDQQAYRIEHSRRTAADLRLCRDPLTLGDYFAQDGVVRSVYHYTRLIRLQHAHGLIQDCFETFEDMKSHGCVPNPRTYSAVLAALCIPTHWSMSMTSEDREQQRPWSEIACRIWDQAMQHAAASRSPFVYSAMLKVYAAFGDAARARLLLELMEKREIGVSSVALERVVRACARNHQYHLSWDTFTDFRHLVGIPSQRLYTRMVHVAGKLKRTADAALLFEELIEVGYKPTVVDYNTILHAASLSRPNWHYVVPLYERLLQDRDCQPDDRTLTIVMVACAKSGDVDTALQLLPKFSTMEIHPQKLHNLFCQFISCLASSNRDHPDPLLLQKSSTDGKLLTVDDRCRLAEETFQSMQMRYDLPITNKTMNPLLYVYISAKKMKPALSVLESFSDHKLQPDVESYKALLSQFVKAILAPDRADLDQLRQSKAWNPNEQIQADLRYWASRVAPRKVGIEALNYVLHPKFST